MTSEVLLLVLSKHHNIGVRFGHLNRSITERDFQKSRFVDNPQIKSRFVESTNPDKSRFGKCMSDGTGITTVAKTQKGEL